MSTTSPYLTVRGIDIDVVYKDIKHLHIGVYPPLGRVRVAAPLRLDDDRVRLAVVQRLAWIQRQRARLQGARRQSEREMVSGESHYVWGRRLRLRVIEQPGRARIWTDGDWLVLRVRPGASTERRRAVLESWYRAELRHTVGGLVKKWEAELDVAVPRWTTRKMKTKWGSCNRDTGHLWFNLELAKKPVTCAEYIVVHELTHYAERHHGDAFVRLMDRRLPDWRARRDALNDEPLADEKW